MIFAAAEPKSFMETYLPYMVLATGLIAAGLFSAAGPVAAGGAYCPVR